jgi:uncharacterized membrane protein YkoI
VCASLALALFAAAQAQPLPEPPEALVLEDLPPAHVVQRGAISLQQATAMATGRYQGRVVRAETASRGDRVVHEIRILGEDGRVRTVRIDAQTGQFL